MTLDTLIMLSGAFVATLPFLGFPNNWDSAVFFIVGIFVIALGIVVRRRYGHIDNPRVPEQHFAEHMPRPQTHEHGQS